MKQCSKCGEWKDESEFYRSKQTSDGRYPSCKSCKYATTRKWVEENREHVDEYHREWREENRERWNEYSARYYEENREHVLEKQCQYYRENRDRINRRKRLYYWRTRQKQLKRSREYKRRNREKVRRRNREYARRNRARMRRYQRWWGRQNKDRVRAKNQRRRARVYDAPGDFTAEEFAELCEMYGNCCLACGSTEDLTADHVVPLSCGGSNSIDNIQPLCRSCNSSKGTNTTDYR